MTDSRESFLGQAWLVLVLSLIFGGTLAGVHVALEDRIDANLRAETLGRIPALILGARVDDRAAVVLLEHGMRIEWSDQSSLELRVDERSMAGHQVFEVIDSGTETRLGWVAKGSGPGYADRIEILIGLDPRGAEITGLYVLSQKETPALGDGITRPAFTNRFVGAPTDGALEVTRSETEAEANPSHILALTAATISSQSVSDIINRTVTEIRSEIQE